MAGPSEDGAIEIDASRPRRVRTDADAGPRADDLLVRRLRARDERAFREMVMRYAPLVRAYSQGILQDHHEAEDAAQETFLRAFRRVAGYRGDGALGAWLLRICRNHCLDRLRSRPALPPVELSDATAGSGDAASGAQTAIDRERLVLLLAALPDGLQQAFVLRELRGLSYDEIAEVLGIPVGTVRSRLAAARERLQAGLRSR